MSAAYVENLGGKKGQEMQIIQWNNKGHRQKWIGIILNFMCNFSKPTVNFHQ